VSVPLTHALGLLLVGLAFVALLVHRRWQARFRQHGEIYQRALALARSQGPESLARGACQAAVELLGARRAHCYLVDRSAAPVLRQAASAVRERGPRPLPERMAPEECAPVARALDGGLPATRLDAQARQAPPAGDDDPRDERSFWPAYGIDAILPVLVDDATVTALLLVGGSPSPAETIDRCAVLVQGMAVALRGPSGDPPPRQALEQKLAMTHGRLVEVSSDLQAAHARLAQAEYQATLGRLVAGIVHEANTPLGTIASSVDTLRRAMQRYRPLVAQQVAAGDPEAERALRAVDAQAEALEVMDGSRQRLSQVLDNLGRFAALDRPEVVPVDICASIDDALALVSVSASEQLRLVKEFPEPHPMIRCQPGKLNQVFLHLLENAVKAVEAVEGSGEVRVTVEVDRDKVRVVIADTGRGIAEAKLPQVLDFGFTIKTGGRMGLRLGLPASRQAVQELGGELLLNSTAGSGTRVVVELPLTRY
jgi:signal transduction histidine kinase